MHYKKAKIDLTKLEYLSQDYKAPKHKSTPSVLNAASYGQPPLPIGDMNKAGEK